MSDSLSAANRYKNLADSLDGQYQSEKSNSVKLDSTATLDDYLAFAAFNNPALRQSFYLWKAELEKSGYAGALSDPMFTYGYVLEHVETRVGPQNQRFGLKQEIPWFGTLGAMKDMASESANTAFQKYQAEKLRLFYSVRTAFYELYYLGRDIALTQDNFELLTFWESVARTRYKVALTEHPDLIKAQVELGVLEDRILTLQSKVRPTVSRLRAAVNLPDTIPVAMPTNLKVTETAVDPQTVLKDALLNNPNLNGMTHMIEKERAGLRVSKKASLPNFTLSVDYIQTGEALNPAMDDSGKDPVTLGVGINLPIWFGKNRAKKNEAKARLRAAEYDYSDSQNRLRTIVSEIVYQYADALRKTSLYRDGLIPKAEQALNAGYTAYQAGESDFLSLLDAQRQLLTFQLQFERAKTDLATRKAEIEMITGNELQNK